MIDCERRKAGRDAQYERYHTPESTEYLRNVDDQCPIPATNHQRTIHDSNLGFRHHRYLAWDNVVA